MSRGDAHRPLPGRGAGLDWRVNRRLFHARAARTRKERTMIREKTWTPLSCVASSLLVGCGLVTLNPIGMDGVAPSSQSTAASSNAAAGGSAPGAGGGGAGIGG